MTSTLSFGGGIDALGAQRGHPVNGGASGPGEDGVASAGVGVKVNHASSIELGDQDESVLDQLHRERLRMAGSRPGGSSRGEQGGGDEDGAHGLAVRTCLATIGEDA